VCAACNRRSASLRRLREVGAKARLLDCPLRYDDLFEVWIPPCAGADDEGHWRSRVFSLFLEGIAVRFG